MPEGTDVDDLAEYSTGAELPTVLIEVCTNVHVLRSALMTVQSVRQLVGSLSGGQRQAGAVARDVMRDSKLVIMDEPTAALGPRRRFLCLPGPRSPPWRQS